MSRRDRLSYAALVGVLVLGFALLGGGLRVPACAIALASVVAAIPGCMSSRRFRDRSPLIVALALMTALTAFQLVPFPAAITRVLSPEAHQAVVDTYAALAESPPRVMMLSRDPAGTLVELAKLLGLTCVAFAALRLASSRHYRRRLLEAVAVAGAVLAVIGLVHHGLGLPRLFGIYLPRDNVPLYLTPLINPNHLAGLLALSAPIAVALTLNSPGHSRFFWATCGLVAIIVCLLTRSRGGMIALAAGLLVFTGLALGRRRTPAVSAENVNTLTVRVPAIAMALCALTLAVYFGGADVLSELSSTDASEWSAPDSKFAAWRSSAALLRDHWTTGVGRGAFESVFTRVHPAAAFHSYSHVENEYLQVAIDWGVPGALAIALTFAWLVVLALHRSRDSVLAAAAFGGLAGIALQNFVDFNIELPGVAIPVLMVLATLTYPQLRRPAQGSGLGALHVAIGVGTVLVAVAALAPWGRSLREDHELLAELGSGAQGAGQDSILRAKQMMRRHPSDYYAPAHLARVLLSAGDVAGARYLAHALTLHPTHPGLHHLVARLLVRQGSAVQARLEYSLAIRFSTDPTALIDEALANWPAADEAAGAFPVERGRVAAIVRELRARGREDVGLAYLSVVTRSDPGEVEYRRLEYRLALAVGDWSRAAQAAREAHRMAPSAESSLALGTALFELGNLDGAEEALGQAMVLDPEEAQRVEVMLLLSRIQMARQDWSAAQATLRGLTALPAAGRHARRIAHERLAAVERTLGNPHQAEWHKARARELRDQQLPVGLDGR